MKFVDYIFYRVSPMRENMCRKRHYPFSLRRALVIEKRKWSAKTYSELERMNSEPLAAYLGNVGGFNYLVEIVKLEEGADHIRVSVIVEKEGDRSICPHQLARGILYYSDGRVDAFRTSAFQLAARGKSHLRGA